MQISIQPMRFCRQKCICIRFIQTRQRTMINTDSAALFVYVFLYLPVFVCFNVWNAGKADVKFQCYLFTVKCLQFEAHNLKQSMESPGVFSVWFRSILALTNNQCGKAFTRLRHTAHNSGSFRKGLMLGLAPLVFKVAPEFGLAPKIKFAPELKG